MKKKSSKQSDPWVLNDRVDSGYAAAPTETMVRTQVYLTREQHEFLAREGERTGTGLSAVLRRLVDNGMSIPQDAWANNPLLEPVPDDPQWAGPEDASLNHDHYAFGGPKKFKKVRGQWVAKTEGED